MAETLIRRARIEDCPALARITIDATQDAFRGRVPDRCLTWLTPEESAANWAKNFKTDQSLDRGNYLFVAETEPSGVIGLAMLSKTPAHHIQDSRIVSQFPYELRSLQVDPAWQRQGVGRRLVCRVAEVLWHKGITQLRVGVLVENPNRAFYERLGAVRLGSQPYEWAGYKTEEILYGWQDIDRLRNVVYRFNRTGDSRFL